MRIDNLKSSKVFFGRKRSAYYSTRAMESELFYYIFQVRRKAQRMMDYL